MVSKKAFPAFFIAFSLILASFTQVKAQDGEALFKQNCTSCHSVGKGTVIGPDLKDVGKRLKEDWLIKWIRSSSAMVKAGDPYAVEVFNKFNKTVMTDQNLSDEEIKSVLSYIDKKSSEPAPTTGPVATAGGEAAQAETDNTGMWLLVAVVLAALVYILTIITGRLEKVIRSRKGQAEPEKLPIRLWARENKKGIALVSILVVMVGSYNGWYLLASIGVNDGYKPDQPIEFSHKIHAGNMNIACVYCHHNAEKSKTAGIPSANVCMNCHKFIKEGKQTGTKEIAKIYAALDYNPETQKYGTNQQPIQWVRVHNLPDLAYFNHSQHVTVGGIACEKCHGEVKEMTVASQFAPLTMGWCIDCHRTTPVNKTGNKYYDGYHGLHFNKLDPKDSTLTVEKIGGTECAKCHY